jgi:hypothetical protein
MAGKRLLTINGSNFEVRSRNNSPDQVFMYDPVSSTIKMYANQQRSVAIGNAGRSRDLVGYKTNGAWYQDFTMQGNFIVNARGLVVDVHKSRDTDGANVIVWKKQGQLNQQWKIEYIEIDTIQNGIIPDKPFKIISKMRGARAITRSKDNVIIRDNNKNDKDQLFVFDSQTGSIQPMKDHNVSLEIADAGRNRFAQFNKERDIWF